MANRFLIPDSLLDDILEKDANGWRAQEIADYLGTKHNIQVNDRIVQFRLAKYKRIEQEARQAAIREASAKSAINYVALIDRNIEQLQAISDKLMEKEDYNAARGMKETLLKYITCQKDTGLQQSDSTTTTLSEDELSQSILSKFANDTKSNRDN